MQSMNAGIQLCLSTRERLTVLCLEHIQNSDSRSMTFYSKAASSSRRMSPFREISDYGTSNLSRSTAYNSLDETEAWNLRLAYSPIMRGIVLAICLYLDYYFLLCASNALVFILQRPDYLYRRINVYTKQSKPRNLIETGYSICRWQGKWIYSAQSMIVHLSLPIK